MDARLKEKHMANNCNNLCVQDTHHRLCEQHLKGMDWTQTTKDASVRPRYPIGLDASSRTQEKPQKSISQGTSTKIKNQWFAIECSPAQAKGGSVWLYDSKVRFLVSRAKVF
jgi:hypothetical protein